MAYRQPAFMVNHVALGLSSSAVTSRNAGTMTTASKLAVCDGRAGPLGTVVATGANGGFIFDLGNTSAGDVINRAVIPAGHSLSGKALQIVKDTIPGMNGFPSPQIALTATAGSGVVDFSTAVNTDPSYRYWALQVNGSTNGFSISVGELWLGTYQLITSASFVQPSWSSEYDHDLAQQNFGGRTATIELGPPRKRFGLEFVNVDLSTADGILLESILTTGRSRPFYYWPPDTNEPGPYLVQLAVAGKRTQEFPAPKATGALYRIGLEMVEQLS